MATIDRMCGRLALAAVTAAALACPVGAQTLAAVTAAEAALAAADDATKLTVRNASIVTAKPAFYGAFEVRPSNHFPSGQPILFYLEPIGLKHKTSGDIVSCGLSMDLRVEQDGSVMFSKEGFLTADFPSHHALHELMVNGDLTVTAPSGSYAMRLVLHDHNSAETTEVMVPFVID